MLSDLGVWGTHAEDFRRCYPAAYPLQDAYLAQGRLMKGRKSLFTQLDLTTPAGRDYAG